MNRSGGGHYLALLVAVWAGSGGMRSGEPTPTLGGNPAAKQTAVAAQPKAKKQSSDKQRGASHLYPDGFDDEGESTRHYDRGSYFYHFLARMTRLN